MAVSLLLISGCGGVECADGTVERDGECVLADGLEQCGDFEVLKGGECIPVGELCDEEGTVYDLSTGKCVLEDDLAVCDDDQVLKDGDCVATDDLCNEDGTVYDVGLGQCVLQDGLEVCDNDQVLKHGECVDTVDLCDDNGTVYDVDAAQCVLQEGLKVCADDEILTDGECVVFEDVCEEGTTLDIETGTCELQEGLAICEDDQVLKDGDCVDNVDLCDEDGTVYDVDTAQCVLQDGLEVCNDDEVLKHGDCVQFDDLCDSDGTVYDVDTDQCVLEDGLAVCNDDQVLKDGDCVDNVDLCDQDGTVYDIDTGQCVLQDGLAVCNDDEALKDGECVQFNDLCDDDGTVYDVDTGQCVLQDGLAVCTSNEVLFDGDCIIFDDLCDEGTTVDVDNSTCVTDEDSCGVNTYFQDGQCVADDPIECGTNTELDPNENTCFVTDEVCGTGTAYDSTEDECIPTDDVCADGTSFSADDGLCYPDAQCKSGDVIVDGICVSPAEALVDDADVVAGADTNPEFGGDPTHIDLDGGDSIFTGTIEPPSDLDGDGELNQHVDVFSFDADAGDWLEISIQSIDPMPNAHFAVYPEADDDVDFYRESPTAVGTAKARQIVIPETGTYLVAVAPEAAFSNDDTLAGDDDWDYVGTIDPIATPAAEQLDEPYTDGITGTLGPLDDNFFVIDISDAGDDDGIRFDWDKTPATAVPTITLWSATDEFLGEYDHSQFSFELPDADDLYIIVDWTRRYGDFGLDYDINLEEVYFIAPDDDFEYQFHADGGEAVVIGYDHDGFGSITVTLTDEDDEVVAEDSLFSFQQLTHIGLQPGEYTVTYTNDRSSTLEGFIPEVRLVEPSPAETFTADDGDSVRITQDNPDGNSVGVVVEDDATDDVVGYEESLSTFGELIVESLDAGDYTVSIFDFDDSVDLSAVDVNVEFDVTSLVTTLQIGADDEGDVLVLTQTNDDGEEIFVEVLDDNDDPIVSGLLPEGGERMRYIGLEAGDYDVYKTVWDDSPTIDLVTDLVTPTPVTDFDETFTGTANEADTGEQQYYAVELDDEVTYELILEHTDGTGWGRLFVYQWDHRLEQRMDDYVSSGSGSIEQTFEANTPYIIRVGNDETHWSYDFDYALSFDEVQ